MNKIEKSIVDGLNNVTSRNGNWKLFSSRFVNSDMELKSDRERQLYQVISNYLNDNKNNINILPIDRFTTQFVKWDNGKVLESINTLVTVKEVEKCLKFYFLENHLELNRYFALSVNNCESDNNVYIVSVCRESGIYKIKEKTSENKTTSENDTSEVDEVTNNLLKISTLINSIASLSTGLDNDTKKSIINELASKLEVSSMATASKVTKIA